MTRSILSATVGLLIVFVGGCARYEYDIVHPEDLRGRIGKTESVFARPPLEYRLVTVENRLVMRIYNGTEDAYQLLGERSSVVDPRGQSHPLTSVALAPQSFIKLVLPPFRPRYDRTGPSFGIGFGTFIARRDGIESEHREPLYLSAYADDEARYWEWKGDGDVRLTLVYQRTSGGEPFVHDFVIHRVKL
jgi:hypothetical protein